MCLELNGPSRAIEKEKARVSHYKKPFKTWKILQKGDISLYRGYQYHLGLNESSRKHTELSPTEGSSGRIFGGFHVYLRKEDALIESKLVRFVQTKVVEAWVHPKDIVAIGSYVGYPCLVATKLTIRSFDNQAK